MTLPPTTGTEAAMTRRTRAFTLIELLVVIGMISVMLSLLLPALGKARAAARSANCLSNLHQLDVAWMMYTAENKGQLMGYNFYTPKTPNVAWNGYWLGVAESNKVRGDALLCPSASQPSDQARGYGSCTFAWNGAKDSAGSCIKFNAATYRVGSYGYNHYLTSGGADSQTFNVAAIKGLSDVPVFFDSAPGPTRCRTNATRPPPSPHLPTCKATWTRRPPNIGGS